jgi:hypothetical protein
VEKDAEEGGSMAEQIPEAWVGQEVIVLYGPGNRQAGTLEDVSAGR